MLGKTSPVERIVASFGGQSAMERATGIAQGTIWGWLNARRIPQKHWPRIVEAAASLPEPVALTVQDFVDLAPAPSQSTMMSADAA